jgi:hypothetical protein
MEPAPFEVLSRAQSAGRLGHALLLITPNPNQPAFRAQLRAFVAFLLCGELKSSETRACGRCESCRLTQQLGEAEGTVHPDVSWIRPENSTGYAVEQIRELKQAFTLTRSLGRNKVAVVEDAETLSANQGSSANALLKLLEEPRPNNFLLLVSSRPEGVLATIRSRAHSFRIPGDARSAAAAATEALQDWQPLLDWMRQGARLEARTQLKLPGDAENFWKEREAALNELESLLTWLWESLRPDWPRLDHEASFRVLDAFSDLERLLARLRGHGNASLQWLAFRAGSAGA